MKTNLKLIDRRIDSKVFSDKIMNANNFFAWEMMPGKCQVYKVKIYNSCKNILDWAKETKGMFVARTYYYMVNDIAIKRKVLTLLK